MNTRVGILIAMLFLVAFGASAVAVAGKKKPPTTKGVTKKQNAALPAGGIARGSATCAKKTHATGGGFSVQGGYNPAVTPATGTNSRPQNLFPAGSRTWKSQVASLSSSTPATTTTTYVRCEKNKFSQYAGTIAGDVSLSQSTFYTLDLKCPASTRVVSGGYSVDPSYDSTKVPGTTANGFWITQSRRTKTDQWSVTAVNASNPTAQIKAYAVCETKKGAGITANSRLVGFGNKTRASVTAKCGRKQHSVSGGFLLSPELDPDVGGQAPTAFVDVSMPVGSTKWLSKLFTPAPTTAPGSALTSYVYCRNNNLKR